MCGYLRIGIATEARCPECGADGLASCVYLMGAPRLTVSTVYGLMVLLALLGTASGIMVVRSRGAPFPIVLLAVAVLAIGLLLWTLRSGNHRSVLGASRIVWTVHPTGVEVREGRRREFIPREDVAAIHSADDLFASMSVLSIVRRRGSLKGLVGTTPVIYVRGPRDDRRERLAEIRQALGVG